MNGKTEAKHTHTDTLAHRKERSEAAKMFLFANYMANLIFFPL